MTSDAETKEKANHFPDSVPSVKVKDSFSIVTREKSTYELTAPHKDFLERTFRKKIENFVRTLQPCRREQRWFGNNPRFCGSIPFVFRLDYFDSWPDSSFSRQLMYATIVPSKNVRNFWSSEPAKKIS